MNDRKEIKDVISIDHEKADLRREQLVGEIQERDRIPREKAEKLLRRKEAEKGGTSGSEADEEAGAS